MILLPALRALSALIGVSGSIGPNTNLYIANKKYSTRWIFSFVRIIANLRIFGLYTHFSFSAVLAGVTERSVAFPGPLIAGYKVVFYFPDYEHHVTLYL